MRFARATQLAALAMIVAASCVPPTHAVDESDACVFFGSTFCLPGLDGARYSMTIASPFQMTDVSIRRNRILRVWEAYQPELSPESVDWFGSGRLVWAVTRDSHDTRQWTVMAKSAPSIEGSSFRTLFAFDAQNAGKAISILRRIRMCERSALEDRLRCDVSPPIAQIEKAVVK